MMKKILIILGVVLLMGCSLFRRGHMTDNYTDEEWAQMMAEMAYRDSVRYANLDFSDTIGSSALFQKALAPQLADAIVRYIDSLETHRKRTEGIIDVSFRMKDQIPYVYLGLSVNNLEDDKDKGYLLYNNSFLIRINYEKRRYAQWVVRLKELHRPKYQQFMYNLMGNYDGNVFCYKVAGPDSVVFVDDGFFGADGEMYPQKWQREPDL